MSAPAYVLLGNGAVARRFLEAQGPAQRPRLVVLNAPGRQREGEGLLAACRAGGVAATPWGDEGRRALLALLEGETEPWLLSVYFGHVLDEEVLRAARGRAVNLHASLLPWNRGANTNVWPIVERSPAGVSLHVMEPAVDRGAVLAQAEVAVEPWDTGASLYAKLEDAGLALLLASWPERVLARWPGVPQAGEGSSHRVAEFGTLERYDADAHPEVRRFFDLLRGRTFPPHAGLRVRIDGVDVEAMVSLRRADD